MRRSSRSLLKGSFNLSVGPFHRKVTGPAKAHRLELAGRLHDGVLANRLPQRFIYPKPFEEEGVLDPGVAARLWKRPAQGHGGYRHGLLLRFRDKRDLGAFDGVGRDVIDVGA